MEKTRKIIERRIHTTNTENKKIDPIEFLTLYQKVDKLKPKTFEYVNGFIDGISAGFDIAVNQQDQKGA